MPFWGIKRGEPVSSGALDLSSVTGFETIGAVPASTAGTTVTAAGSTNTKGSWTQLVASTAVDSSFIEVRIGVNSTGARFLVDIGRGAAASEVVLIPDLSLDATTVGTGESIYRFPINIPSGTRLAARVQSSSASATVHVTAILYQGGVGTLGALTAIQTYGADTSDSGLTAIDPGGVAHTDSSWVQLTASTSADAGWLHLALGQNANTAGNVARWLIDIATGAAASEVVLISDIFVNSYADRAVPAKTFACPVTIPAGTRIAVRARCSSTNATDRLIEAAVHLAATE